MKRTERKDNFEKSFKKRIRNEERRLLRLSEEEKERRSVYLPSTSGIYNIPRGKYGANFYFCLGKRKWRNSSHGSHLSPQKH